MLDIVAFTKIIYQNELSKNKFYHKYWQLIPYLLKNIPKNVNGEAEILCKLYLPSIQKLQIWCEISIMTTLSNMPT